MTVFTATLRSPRLPVRVPGELRCAFTQCRADSSCQSDLLRGVFSSAAKSLESHVPLHRSVPLLILSLVCFFVFLKNPISLEAVTSPPHGSIHFHLSIKDWHYSNSSLSAYIACTVCATFCKWECMSVFNKSSFINKILPIYFQNLSAAYTSLLIMCNMTFLTFPPRLRIVL